ncbi:SDR family oxidoreductase [Dokdonella sp. MW10]|uniref:SDR family oxidoreductase n=1 Tax=Dokdonella sp. MW10 TaxID=2992926 RepID=UPI003F812E56
MNAPSRIALVTGATRGIGFETVRQLAAEGVHVLLAGRDPARAAVAAAELKADGLPVEPIALDVTDEASIAAAVEQVRAKYGRLDILVNNAGIAIDNGTLKPSQQTMATWRTTFDTNVFGLIAVTNAFLPLLHASPSARIVNVSSLLGSIREHLNPESFIYDFKIPAYNVSKTAVNAWTVQLAHELRGSTVKVNTIHPGYVRTDMNKHGDEQNGELEVADGAATSVRLALIDDAGPSGGYFYRDEALPW